MPPAAAIADAWGGLSSANRARALAAALSAAGLALALALLLLPPLPLLLLAPLLPLLLPAISLTRAGIAPAEPKLVCHRQTAPMLRLCRGCQPVTA